MEEKRASVPLELSRSAGCLVPAVCFSPFSLLPVCWLWCLPAHPVTWFRELPETKNTETSVCLGGRQVCVPASARSL